MASYRRVPRKDGKRVYELSAYRGRDPITKKLLSPYTKRWTPPDDWSDEKCEKEAMKHAHRFEIECLKREQSRQVMKEPEAPMVSQNISESHKIDLSDNHDKTVREYVHEYLDRMKLINETSTYFNKQKSLIPFVETLGDVRLKDLNTNLLEDYYFKLCSTPTRRTGKMLKPSTKREKYKTINACLRYGQDRGIVPYFRMPNRECLLIKKEDTCVEKKYLSIADIKEIISVLPTKPPQIRALVWFLIDTGCRIGEAVALRWGDVNLVTGEYKIRYNKSQVTKGGRCRYDAVPKTGKIRTDYLNPTCVSVLKELETSRVGQGEKDFVFCGEGGTPLPSETVQYWLYKIGDEVGIDHLHAHQFRHAVASIMLNRGIDPVSVAQKLGHASPDTTMRIYAHAMPNDYSRRNTVYANAVYS